MRVLVKGRGTVDLHQGDFVASGGEASIYRKGDRSFKIYTDPNRVVPAGKLQELGRITDPLVIKPEAAVFDEHGKKAVGYTMRFVDDVWSLCQLFPRAFRDRNGLTPDLALKLTTGMQKTVSAIHQAGVLCVDMNEMNNLVRTDFSEVYFIDVDSYQTRSYPATAIMDSVRDWHVHNNDWTELSDWFSFAVITFQLMTGIHPYKGRHDSVKGFEARCRANLSVFNPAVRVPHAALDPKAVIPDGFRAWYKAVLEDGKRVPPPKDYRAPLIVVPVVRALAGSGHFVIDEVFVAPKDTIRVFSESHGRLAVRGAQRCFFDFTGQKIATRGPESRPGAVLAWTPKMNWPVQVFVDKEGHLAVQDIPSKATFQMAAKADAVMSYDGRAYVKSGRNILEVHLHESRPDLMPSTQVVSNVLPHATKLYEGVAVQDLLGSTFVSLFPRSGACYQARIAELDPYRIVDAKFDSGVLMVLCATRKGQYDRLVFRFDTDNYVTYDVRKVEDVTPTGLNFVVLDSGVVLCVTEDEKVELTSARRGSSSLKLIDDPAIGGDMRLVKLGGRGGFVRGNKVFNMRMK